MHRLEATTTNLKLPGTTVVKLGTHLAIGFSSEEDPPQSKQRTGRCCLARFGAYSGSISMNRNHSLYVSHRVFGSYNKSRRFGSDTYRIKTCFYCKTCGQKGSWSLFLIGSLCICPIGNGSCNLSSSYITICKILLLRSLQ